MAENNVQVQFGAQISGAVSGIKQVGDQLGSLRSQTDSLQSSFSGLGNMLRGLVGYFGAREVIAMADGFKLLEGRVRLSTQSTQEFQDAMSGLLDISSKTGSSIDASINIFQRLSQSRKEINATNEEMLQFTETVSKLGIISGASHDALKFGLTQLGQSLSSDIVRAEEFNSIMENIPAVGKAIADEFGITAGQLRNLVVNGKVQSKDLFAAIINQSEEANRKFEQFPTTVGMAFQRAKIGITEMIGKIDESSSATGVLIDFLVKVGDVARDIGTGFQIIVAVIKVMSLQIKQFWNDMEVGWQNIHNKFQMALEQASGGLFKANIQGGAYKIDLSEDTYKANDELRSILADLNNPKKAQSSGKRSIDTDYQKLAAELSGKGNNDAAKKAQQERLKMALDELETNRQIGQAKIDDLRKNLDTEVNLGHMTEAKKLQMLRQYEQQSYEIDRTALIKSAELEGLTVAQKQRLYNQLRVLKQKHENQMQEINRKSAELQAAKYKEVTDTFTSSFKSAVQGVVMGTQTIGQALSNMASSILSSIVGIFAEMVANWILTQVLGLATAGTTARATVAGHAAEAGAAAYASTAAIPIVGPELAPAASKLAYVGAMAYQAAVPGFAVGAWDLPSDTLAMLHKGETIMDASSARTFREGMARSGGTMTGGGSAGGKTDIHIHAVDANSFKRMLANNSSTITKTIKKAARGFDSNLASSVRGK